MYIPFHAHHVKVGQHVYCRSRATEFWQIGCECDFLVELGLCQVVFGMLHGFIVGEGKSPALGLRQSAALLCGGLVCDSRTDYHARDY